MIVFPFVLINSIVLMLFRSRSCARIRLRINARWNHTNSENAMNIFSRWIWINYWWESLFEGKLDGGGLWGRWGDFGRVQSGGIWCRRLENLLGLWTTKQPRSRLETIHWIEKFSRRNIPPAKAAATEEWFGTENVHRTREWKIETNSSHFKRQTTIIFTLDWFPFKTAMTFVMSPS